MRTFKSGLNIDLHDLCTETCTPFTVLPCRRQINGGNTGLKQLAYKVTLNKELCLWYSAK